MSYLKVKFINMIKKEYLWENLISDLSNIYSYILNNEKEIPDNVKII